MANLVSPSEAHDLVTQRGYAYLDVRTVAEFDAGHPAGAYNVPLMIDGPNGRGPNPDFVAVVSKAFPKDTKLVVGCQAGTRSARAAGMLEAAGYGSVSDQGAGWGGRPDAFGRMTQPGWKAAGLPTATTPEPGRSWAELANRP